MGCFCGSANNKYGKLEKRAFVVEGKNMGEGSLHFKSKMCYVSWKKATDEQKMENGEPLPAKLEFKGVAFDEAKRTFVGTIEWPSAFEEKDKEVYSLTFAEDFGSITEGTVVTTLKGEGEKTLKVGEDVKYAKAPKQEGDVNKSFSSYGTVEAETKEETKEEEKKEGEEEKKEGEE